VTDARKRTPKEPNTPRMPPHRKTLEGVAAASHNALKHGLFSTDLIIRRGVHKEEQADFDALLQRLAEDLKPAGYLQEVLVERIAVILWRLRRYIRWERFLFENYSLTVPGMGSPDDMSATELLQLMKHSGNLPVLYKKRALHRLAQLALQDLTAAGLLSIPEELLSALDPQLAEWNDKLAMAIGQQATAEERAEWSPSPAPTDVPEETWRDQLNGRLNALESQLRSEISTQEIRDADVSTPLDEGIVIGGRYETTLERQLYRALAELRVLQSQ
jgi:hypothetical protein